MSTISLLWWIMVVSGLVQIVTQSSLFEPVRRVVANRSSFLGELLSCPLCFGTWTGIGFSLLGISPSLTLLSLPGSPWFQRVLAALFDGCGASFAAFGWVALRGYLSRPAVVQNAPIPVVSAQPNVSPNVSPTLAISKATTFAPQRLSPPCTAAQKTGEAAGSEVQDRYPKQLT